MKDVEPIRNLSVPELGCVHIWHLHVPSMQEALEALYGLLNDCEREKADRFHRAEDRAASICARGTLRVLLSGYTGIPAPAVEFAYSENGKPHLVSPASCRPDEAEQGRRAACDTIPFNVSHSGEWVLIAVGRNQHIGIDVEKIRTKVDVMAIASRYFAPEESSTIESSENCAETFFRYWTRKESYVKALGSGLFRELSSFAVPLIDGERDGWFFHDLAVAPGYAAAVVTDCAVDKIEHLDFSAAMILKESCGG